MLLILTICDWHNINMFTKTLLALRLMIIMDVICVHQVSLVVMKGHKLGFTGWCSLCTACRVRGVS